LWGTAERKQTKQKGKGKGDANLDDAENDANVSGQGKGQSMPPDATDGQEPVEEWGAAAPAATGVPEWASESAAPSPEAPVFAMIQDPEDPDVWEC